MSDRELRARIECDPAGSTVTVHVRDIDGDRVIDLEVERGTVLRDALFDAGISPYAQFTKRVNCGGRGLRVACGVQACSGELTPDHQHGGLAARFGYLRFLYQFHVDGPLTVELAEKVVWGGRE